MCSLVTKQQHQITSLKSAISKLSLNYTGTLIWKITDYATKMSEAKAKEGMELVSPPFYTSQYGYKLQVCGINNSVNTVILMLYKKTINIKWKILQVIYISIISICYWGNCNFINITCNMICYMLYIFFVITSQLYARIGLYRKLIIENWYIELILVTYKIDN